MKALFLCNTPYQILVASCIARYVLPNGSCDLIVSDHMSSGKKLAERIQSTRYLFSHVMYAETKCFYTLEMSERRLERIRALRSPDLVEQVVALPARYDLYFCANADPFSVCLYRYIKLHNNRKAKACWFEDGLGTYGHDSKYFAETKKSAIRRRIFELLGIRSLLQDVTRFYVFMPESMDWKPNVPVCKIPVINKQDNGFIDGLNQFFDYAQCTDNYDKKLIFFEDGYGDWSDSTDLDLMKLFLSSIPLAETIIKIHPRNKENRFQKLGYTTNEHTGIPWEIIALNTDTKNSILVTMYSQSVIMPFVLFGTKTKAIILAKLDPQFEKKDHAFFDYLSHYYYSKYPDLFFVPNTVDELTAYIATIQ